VSAEHVRARYNVDYKRGERLIVDGRPGTLVSFPGQNLGIRFDGQKRTRPCHPTWRVRRPAQPEPTTCTVCGAVSPEDHAACLRLSGRTPA
jgi:hypothetical protein